MKGLDIGFWFPRPGRGARLAEELRELGHEVTVYHSLPVPGDQAHVSKVAYSFVPGLRLLRSLRHDIMYTSRSFLPVLQLRASRWLGGSPYVYTINGAIWAYYSDRGASWRVAYRPIYPLAFSQAVAGAGAVVANSRFLAGEIETRLPGQAAKVSAIYNGIDYDGVDAGRPRHDAWPPGKTRALSVVTLNLERKTEGPVLLAQAFERLCRRHPDLSYVVAAKSENPAAVARVRAHIARLGCADRIRVDVNRTDVPDLLAAADLFLYATPPDSSDSLPRALLEAQAAGVPTVTTATTGCGEAVLDGETGRAVPYDSEAVAEAAAELLSNSALARRLADRGKVLVRERFSWGTMAREYEQVFRRVVAGT